MERRTFLASGVLGAFGVTACGGGGGGDSPAPAPAATTAPTLFAMGWLQMPTQTYQGFPQIASANFPTVGGFPQFDLSDTGFLASAGYPQFLPAPDSVGQGRQPSCTAWAVGYAAATATMRYAGASLPAPISPADLFAKILRRSPTACTDGSMISYAMDTLVQEGATTLLSAPYFDQQCGIPSVLPAVQLDGSSRIEAADATAIRGAIQSMQPVSFGMLVDERFRRLSATNALYAPSGTGGGHAMSVIGYDDATQRYKVMNSWGTGWGAGGFFWMSYADFARVANDVCIPYLRNIARNDLLASSTSSQTSPIVAQHMTGNRFGNTATGMYTVGVEMGWSAPLSLQAASIAVLDSNQTVLFSRDFPLRQIARGIRIGTEIPASATSFGLIRSSISGVDAFGAALTLTTFVRSVSR